MTNRAETTGGARHCHLITRFEGAAPDNFHIVSSKAELQRLRSIARATNR